MSAEMHGLEWRPTYCPDCGALKTSPTCDACPQPPAYCPVCGNALNIFGGCPISWAHTAPDELPL